MENTLDISKEDFEFVQKDEKIFDEKFKTKNIGFFGDALRRFATNKASIVAGILILIIVLFAIIAPATSNYDSSFNDTYYKYVSPKSNLFSSLGWDGCTTKTINSKSYKQYTEYYPIGTVVSAEKAGKTVTGSQNYVVKLDTYYSSVGYVTVSLSESEWTSFTAWAVENDYITQEQIDNNYISYVNNDYGYDKNQYELIAPYASSVGINNCSSDDWAHSETEGHESDWAIYDTTAGGQYKVRVNYYEYFQYVYGCEPCFIFGTNNLGQDLFSRLGLALRFSLILGVIVAFVNIAVGILIGSIEGYYGGVVDLAIERIIELLTSVPMIVVTSLIKFHHQPNTAGEKMALLCFVFFLTGWTGIAATVRSQFYRYKGHEYVLAARTLGAGDRRIIFRHILPNAIGPVITQAVLMIPSVIFSEASLAYLNIIDFTYGEIASVGSLLSSGQSCMTTAPFVLIFPSIFVCVLMVSFNIFGNGLRDAFNPSLRGAE